MATQTARLQSQGFVIEDLPTAKYDKIPLWRQEKPHEAVELCPVCVGIEGKQCSRCNGKGVIPRERLWFLAGKYNKEMVPILMNKGFRLSPPPKEEAMDAGVSAPASVPTCDECGKTFKNKLGLTGHMRSHK